MHRNLMKTLRRMLLATVAFVALATAASAGSSGPNNLHGPPPPEGAPMSVSEDGSAANNDQHPDAESRSAEGEVTSSPNNGG